MFSPVLNNRLLNLIRFAHSLSPALGVLFMRDWLSKSMQTLSTQCLSAVLALLVPVVLGGLVYLRETLALLLLKQIWANLLLVLIPGLTATLAACATYFYFRPKFKFAPKLGAFHALKVATLRARQLCRIRLNLCMQRFRSVQPAHFMQSLIGFACAKFFAALGVGFH